ncbi:hypothetical protein FS842_009044 [Serendipita sp. 407]|nr:hypothetical protein FS842_009044 [Serendipita sp. 407]
MHFSVATLLTIAPLLALSSPVPQSPRATIPLSRRSNLYREDGSLDLAVLRGQLSRTTAKIMRGFRTYNRNTGERHPLQPDETSNDSASKRAVGKDSLTDGSEQLWYGMCISPTTSYLWMLIPGTQGPFPLELQQ